MLCLDAITAPSVAAIKGDSRSDSDGDYRRHRNNNLLENVSVAIRRTRVRLFAYVAARVTTMLTDLHVWLDRVDTDTVGGNPKLQWDRKRAESHFPISTLGGIILGEMENFVVLFLACVNGF